MNNVNEVVESVLETSSTSLLWKDIGQDQLDQLWNLPCATSRLGYLGELLNVKHYHDNPRSRILVDFLFFGLVFAREDAKLDDKKTSVLYSILKSIFEHSTQRGELPSLEENYKLFRELMMKHSVDLPPECCQVFSLQDVLTITTYMTKTFYQHYKAYQYAFSEPQKCVKRDHPIVVEIPITPMPLSLSCKVIKMEQQPIEDPIACQVVDNSKEEFLLETSNQHSSL